MYIVNIVNKIWIGDHFSHHVSAMRMQHGVSVATSAIRSESGFHKAFQSMHLLIHSLCKMAPGLQYLLEVQSPDSYSVLICAAPSFSLLNKAHSAHSQRGLPSRSTSYCAVAPGLAGNQRLIH
jgi:hypothetical protein